MVLAAQRGTRMAETQVPRGEFRATKGLEVESRGLERDGNRSNLLTGTQKGEG